MMATQTPGRSREELLAAAAALTAAIHEVDDNTTAELLGRRAGQFEKEAWDAPPITAAGEVTDERLLAVVEFAFTSGWATASATMGVPYPLASGSALRAAARIRQDPLSREELLNGARNALAGRCSCGGPHPGHADHGAADGGQ